MRPSEFRMMTRDLIVRAGGGLTVDLRRSSTLRNQRTGAAVVALTFAAGAASGATAVTLRADHLRGDLIAGSQFTVSGHAAPYVVQSDATAQLDGSLVLSILPGLSGAVSMGATATVTVSTVDARYEAMQVNVDSETVSPTLDGVARKLHLAAVPGRRAPREGDLLLSASGAFGARERVAKVHALEPRPGEAVRWTVSLATQSGVA